MTYQKLASMIAKREGKKSQVAIGNMREIIKHIVDIEVEFAMKFRADEMPVGISPLDFLCIKADMKEEKLRKKKKI